MVDNNMKIIEIINNNHIFGHGQISHDPRDYFLNCNGSLLYSFIKGKPDAVIKTDNYNINIKVASGFCLQIEYPDGWCVGVNKQLINTASPECCVAAAEEQIRIVNNIGKNMRRLRAYREAAGLTRAELGKLADIHPQLIAKYELGERELEQASYASVSKLAAALQCDIKVLTAY